VVEGLAAAGLAAILLAGAVVGALMVVALVLRPVDLTAYAEDHTAFVAVAAAIALSAAALLAGLVTALTRRG
jgi:hypothetical protein